MDRHDEEAEATPLAFLKRGPPQACIFVASIGTDTTEEKLRGHFSSFGPVLKVKLMKDKAMRPYAFVQFEETASADASLVFEQHVVDGRKVRVERAKVNRTLFIAKFGMQMTAPELRKQAEIYGPVESVTIIKHAHTNKSKGCGFVKYQYREDAADAFAGMKARNKKWVVEWATSSNDPEALGVTKNVIYVGGLPSESATEAMLLEHFGRYGNIEEISLVHPHAIRSPSGEMFYANPMATNLAGQESSSAALYALPHPSPYPSLHPIPSITTPSTLSHALASTQLAPPGTDQPQSGATRKNLVLASRTSSPGGSIPSPSTTSSSQLIARFPAHQTFSPPATSISAEFSPDLPGVTPPPTVTSAPAGAPSPLLVAIPPSPFQVHVASPLPFRGYTSYAFITFSEDAAASAAIENENGSTFHGGSLRVQYCETPEMKIRKKMTKIRDCYPQPVTEPNFGGYLVQNPESNVSGLGVAAPFAAFYSSTSPLPTSPLPSPAPIGYWVPSPSQPTQIDQPTWYVVAHSPHPLSPVAAPSASELSFSLRDSSSSPHPLAYAYPSYPTPTGYHQVGFTSPPQLSPLGGAAPQQPFFPLGLPPEGFVPFNPATRNQSSDTH